jgi:dTMP kinase
MLITFEGIDGSGKSTQARRLADALEAAGRRVVRVREPGGTALGERVRALLLDPAAAITPTAELLLFGAARAQLVDEVVRPALAAGAVVVADRFYDSTTAYQGGGRALFDPAWLDAFHAHVTGGLAPARTYLLDVPVEVALARRAGQADDRMEAGGAAFFERVRAAYLAAAARHPDRVVVLDGTRPPDALHAEILGAVERAARRDAGAA